MLNLIDTVAAARELAAEASALSRALLNLMRAEKDAARSAVLHRLSESCRECALHITHALSRLGEVTKQSAAVTLSGVADELKQALAHAPANDRNRAAIEEAIQKVVKIRGAVGKI